MGYLKSQIPNAYESLSHYVIIDVRINNGTAD